MRERLKEHRRWAEYWPVALFVLSTATVLAFVAISQRNTQHPASQTAVRRPSETWTQPPADDKAFEPLDQADAAPPSDSGPNLLDWGNEFDVDKAKAARQDADHGLLSRVAFGMANIGREAQDALSREERERREREVGIRPGFLSGLSNPGAPLLPPLDRSLLPLPTLPLAGLAGRPAADALAGFGGVGPRDVTLTVDASYFTDMAAVFAFANSQILQARVQGLNPHINIVGRPGGTTIGVASRPRIDLSTPLPAPPPDIAAANPGPSPYPSQLGSANLAVVPPKATMPNPPVLTPAPADPSVLVVRSADPVDPPRLWRARLPQFSAKAKAEAALAKLKAEGYTCRLKQTEDGLSHWIVYYNFTATPAEKTEILRQTGGSLN
jgi:hypothetical protein